MSGPSDNTSDLRLPASLPPQLTAFAEEVWSNPVTRKQAEDLAIRYMPQIENGSYDLLQAVPDGSLNVSGKPQELGDTSIGKEIEAKTGLDLSSLSGIQSISKTDEKGKIVVGMQSSGDLDVTLKKLLPGVDLDLSKDASFAIEQPDKGQVTLDDFKGVQINTDGISFDPTKVTIDKAADGDPELHLQGTAKKFGVGVPANATVELKNGKAVVTDKGLF